MVKTTDASDWANAAGATQVLLRSRIEIARLLKAAIDAEMPVVASLHEDEGFFVSRLLGLSSDGSHLLMGYCDDKAANANILAAGSVTLCLNYKNSHIEFLACHVVENFDAGTAIRFDFPDALLIQQRRSHRRIALIPSVPLSCLAESGGVMPFHAKIMDISIGGLGAMVYAEGIQLAPGTVLKDCRITLPDLSQATVDILVRQVGDMMLFEGCPAYRASCSFVGDTDVIESLVKVFLLELERREGES